MTPKKKSQPAEGVPEKQVVISFGVYPSEVERWKQAARAADRPLSGWVRNRLNAAVVRESDTHAQSQQEVSNT